MANEYFWECLAVCLSENRKVHSQIYPKIEDFVASILVKTNYLG